MYRWLGCTAKFHCQQRWDTGMWLNTAFSVASFAMLLMPTIMILLYNNTQHKLQGMTYDTLCRWDASGPAESAFHGMILPLIISVLQLGLADAWLCLASKSAVIEMLADIHIQADGNWSQKFSLL